MTEKVLVERQGAVARIVLNAPEALNAISPDLAREFSRVAAEVGEDPAVRCVIVTGAGPHFAAGGDIRCFAEWLELPAAERDARFAALISDVSDAVSRLRTMAKPVIGAVRGAAAGFGFSLMCGCDVVLASDTTNCKLAYCQLAASPDGGGSHTLPRLLGVRKAMEIALLDERIDAARALELGLVSKVVADAALDDEAMALAQRLAGQATGAFGRTKRLFNASFDNDLSTQLEAELQAFLAGAATQDFAEGVAAFLGRRKPEFHGR
jgi:2-(1,2-epoxy-1,2-dihydrophenyl)acetyl-CoA isomerase